jgi:hypothetical protein
MKPKLGDYIVIVKDYNIPVARGTIGKVIYIDKEKKTARIKVIKWGKDVGGQESIGNHYYHITPHDEIIIFKGKNWKDKLMVEML